MSEKFSFPPPTLFDGEGGDPEPGCGCGEDCDRGPGDPCSLDELDTLADLYLHLTAEDVYATHLIDADPNARMPDLLRKLWETHGFRGTWYILCGIAAVQLDAPD